MGDSVPPHSNRNNATNKIKSNNKISLVSDGGRP